MIRALVGRPSRTRRTPRSWAVAAAVVVAVLALTGCEGAYDLPLPGGSAMDGKGYQVTAEFADVLDLVPQSAVKVNDVTVGRVVRISVDGWTARVTLHVDQSVHLPANATAELEQTSLLGEKYVALSPPEGVAPQGKLTNGAVIPLARTSRDAQVEDVLGALSLLLNGGGVAQLKVITTELNAATHGNEASIRDLVSRLDTFVGGLDAQKSQIVKALDAVDQLSASLNAQKADLATALVHLPAGLKLLADQRQQLTAMLSSLDRLGAVGTQVITASKTNTVADLKALQPTLAQLTKSGDDLPNSLRLLLSFPFPDDATQGAIKGDYANLHATLDLNVAELLKQNAAGLKAGGLSGLPSLPSLPALPSQPALPSLPGLCIPLVPCGSTTSGPQVPDAASLLKSLEDSAPSLLGSLRPPAGSSLSGGSSGDGAGSTASQAALLSLLLGGLSR
jgi:phospholipid/cholesterol/gamma-HCH transport system substrate-binding protein